MKFARFFILPFFQDVGHSPLYFKSRYFCGSKKLVVLYFFLFVTAALAAQPICGFDQSNHLLLEQFPQLKKQAELDKKKIAATVALKRDAGPSMKTTTIYQIPVVVHILHTGDTIGSANNPSREQIVAALDYLNAIYSGTHPSLTPAGVNAAGDMGLRFILAKRDPDCNPTDGINRVDMSDNATYVYTGAKNNDIDYDVTMKSPIAWNQSRYYNIYVVNKINGKDGSSGQFIAGFAYLPSNNIVDGIVMLASQMKPGSKTLAHEMGHAFGLLHPFEGSSRNNMCPVGSGDGVDDTDPISYNINSAGVVDFTCRTGANRCNANKPFNIRTESNFMNYTNCYTLFTPGQKSRLQAYLTVDARASLIQSTASLETYDGNSQACEPKINFEEDSTSFPNAFVAEDGCRKYTDHTFYITIGNQPTAQAVATLAVDSSSEAKEGIDFDFISGKRVVFPAGSRGRRSFKLRIYNTGQRESPQRIAVTFSVNSGGGNAKKGTARPVMRIRLPRVDNSPIVEGTSRLFEIGVSDRVIDDAFMFDETKRKQKTLLLYRAKELQALGISAGYISGIGFMIDKKTNGAFNNYRIGMAQTAAANLLHDGAISIIDNVKELMFMPEVSTKNGWNDFSFQTPFYWDGISNICVQLCFDSNVSSESGKDILMAYSDDSEESASNMVNGDGVECGDFFSSYSYQSSGIKPIIRLNYHFTGNPVAAVLPIAVREYLGPFSEIFIYDQSSPRNIIASIKNLTDWNYGCITTQIDRSGNNTAALWNATPANMVTSKSFYFEPQYNNPAGRYELTLYYTANEKNGYELATGNSWANIGLVKTKVPVKNITPANPQYNLVEINNQVEHLLFGEDYALKATFSSGFSGFAAGIISTALPVTWLNVSAQYLNKDVVVNWQTEAEINNEFFDVEVSTDGIHFNAIASERSSGGGAAEKNLYKYVHQMPPTGVLYYRIKQVDFDGKSSYSDVVQVSVPVITSAAKVYPVPANELVMVSFGKNLLNAVVQVISTDGKLLFNEKLSGLHNQKRISLVGWAKGTYVVRVLAGSDVEVLRFIKN